MIEAIDTEGLDKLVLYVCSNAHLGLEAVDNLPVQRLLDYFTILQREEQKAQEQEQRYLSGLKKQGRVHGLPNPVVL